MKTKWQLKGRCIPITCQAMRLWKKKKNALQRKGQRKTYFLNYNSLNDFAFNWRRPWCCVFVIFFMLTNSTDRFCLFSSFVIRLSRVVKTVPLILPTCHKFAPKIKEFIKDWSFLLSAFFSRYGTSPTYRYPIILQGFCYASLLSSIQLGKIRIPNND